MILSDRMWQGGLGVPPRLGRRPGDDDGAEDHQDKGGRAGAGQGAEQREPSLPDHGLQPGQLLPVQGAVRGGWRRGATGAESAQADPEEPRGGGGGGGYRGAGAGAADVGPGAGGERAGQAGAGGLAGGGALRVAAPWHGADKAPHRGD